MKQAWKSTYNVPLGRVHATMAAVGK